MSRLAAVRPDKNFTINISHRYRQNGMATWVKAMPKIALKSNACDIVKSALVEKRPLTGLIAFLLKAYKNIEKIN